MTLALVIAGGFVVSPTVAASGDCQGEGAFEKYVELEDPVVFDTDGENGVTVSAYIPTNQPDLYHRLWTRIECGDMLEAWLECIQESGAGDALETCMV